MHAAWLSSGAARAAEEVRWCAPRPMAGGLVRHGLLHPPRDLLVKAMNARTLSGWVSWNRYFPAAWGP